MGMTRRTFLAGAGAGLTAAGVAVAVGVRACAGPARSGTPAGAVEMTAYVDRDGWMLTAADVGQQGASGRQDAPAR